MKLKKRNAELIRDMVLGALGGKMRGWTGHTIFSETDKGWHVYWVNGAVTLCFDSNRRPSRHSKHFYAYVGTIGGMPCHNDLSRVKTEYFELPFPAIREACKYASRVFAMEWTPVITSVLGVMSRHDL